MITFKEYFKNKEQKLLLSNYDDIKKEIKTLSTKEVKSQKAMTNFIPWKIKSHIRNSGLTDNEIDGIVNNLKNHDKFTMSVFIKSPGRQNICERTQLQFLRDIKELNVQCLSKSKAERLTDGTLKTKSIDAKINGIDAFLKVVKGKNGGFQDNIFKEAEQFADIAKNYYPNRKFIILAHIFPFHGEEHLDCFGRYKKLEDKNVKVFNCDTINKENIIWKK